ncbi:MAG: fumarylacetoacetate hydrolase family protein [Woeseiaceae bacterium]|nr:fumarylacetoacetate hydrolase family protein [Woeseiaceae bacterium]
MKPNLFVLILLLAAFAAEAQSPRGNSESPDVAFKLATFRESGVERVGMLLGERLLDLGPANAALENATGAPALRLPTDMKALLEVSETVKPRLFHIANHFGPRVPDLPFAYAPDAVAIQAPVKYPWNLLAAGQNYRAHAAEMGGATDIDPDADDPFLFAKSPRSAIIAPREPYVIPPGRDRIDWEGEFAIVIGKRAKDLTLETALDHVFGFTILYDVSDRAAQSPEDGRYARDWFAGKSMDRAAPMGPWIVPKEFLPNHADLDLVTRVNGEIMQQSNTSYMIHDVARILRYVTSKMTLWPGDVIATGTPAGVGNGRNPPVYLKPGDTVEITIEGIGTLVTPIR